MNRRIWNLFRNMKGSTVKQRITMILELAVVIVSLGGCVSDDLDNTLALK